MIENARSLGLESGTVLVVPYDPGWPALFEVAARELTTALGCDSGDVHHVGSTAVPGLCAKPIIDILVSVRDLEESRRLIPRIVALGYEFRPDEEIRERHFLRRCAGTARTHHLSLAEPLSSYHTDTITFRDRLRSDPAEARAYGELKLALARQYPRDRAAYIAGKTEFVLRVLRGA